MFKADTKPVSYILTISNCPDNAEIKERRVFNPHTDEHLVVKFQSKDMPKEFQKPHVTYKLPTGSQLSVIRQLKSEQSFADAL
jgi:hypothetical protein